MQENMHQRYIDITWITYVSFFKTLYVESTYTVCRTVYVESTRWLPAPTQSSDVDTTPALAPPAPASPPPTARFNPDIKCGT